jgi:hypothetical protein
MPKTSIWRAEETLLSRRLRMQFSDTLDFLLMYLAKYPGMH